jgi:tetratricopeptide (TPR) repeat protein
MALRSLLLVLCLALSLAPNASAEADVSAAELQRSFQALQAAWEASDFPAVENLTQSILGNRDLPDQTREALTNMLGFSLAGQNKCDEGLDLLERASAAPVASGSSALAVFAASRLCRLDERAAAALSVIVQRFPERLADLDADEVVNVASRSNDAALLSYLVNGRWRPDSSVELTSLRLQLARIYMNQGQQALAQETAQALIVNGSGDLGSVVMLFVERTFDPIVSADPETFNFESILQWQLANARQHVAQSPNSLSAVNTLARALLDRDRLEEAMTLLDASLARIDAAGASATAFSDQAEHVNWTHNARANVQSAMNDPEDALESLRQAAETPEQGGDNVSQRLNLASLLVGSGRGAEALVEIDSVDVSNASAYGRTVIHGLAACASYQTNDLNRARSEFEYLQQHAEDSLANLEFAALCIQDANAAAEAFIAQLESPGARRHALLGVQTFIDDNHDLPFHHEIRMRSAAVLARPDVQAALARIGRIQSFPIRRPN